MADILPVQEVMIEQGSALLLSVPENKPDAVLDALTGAPCILGNGSRKKQYCPG